MLLTSESNNEDFHKFFRINQRELAYRLKGLLENKYKKTIVPILKKGGEISPIFGMLKIGDITIYIQPKKLSYANNVFHIGDFSCFLIMKDLRKQTKIMVTLSSPHAIVYSAHTIRRYKERLNLDREMEFVDVCKHMFLAGCGHPRNIADMSKVHGTNINRRVVYIMIKGGAFLGYYYGETNMLYAETFLSSNEFREDQAFMDININPDLQQWKEIHELYLQGKLTIDELRERLYSFTRIALDNGQVKILSQEEIEEDNKRLATRLEDNPNFFEDQIEPNKQKAINRIRRKGYK